MRKHHLYAAKLSINENLFTQQLENLKTLFLEAISTSSIFLNFSGSLWNFIDIERIRLDGRFLIAGRLLRAKDEVARVVDTKKISIKTSSVENAASWSNFLFDYETEIVIFEERKGRISRRQFLEVFKLLVEINSKEIGDIAYVLLPAAENIKQELKKFKHIYFARFELIPANWDDEEEFNDLDEELKKLGATQAVHEYKTKYVNGLNPESKFFSKPVNMALAGYGNFDIKGNDLNGERKHLKSSQELLYESIESGDDNIEEFSKNYLIILKRAIQQHLGAASNGEE